MNRVSLARGKECPRPNYFAFPNAAARYASGRPFFHPIVADAIRSQIVGKVPKAIDVACGTGLSTRILAEFAEDIIGTDLSDEMLAEAFHAEKIRYVRAAAEQLPFVPASFDLMTVGLAFHWFDRAGFLAEAQRVLKPGGLLFVYNHAFRGEMACNPRFADWNKTYLRRYPTPPRDTRPLTSDDAEFAGFEYVSDQRFTNYWPFTVEELAAYLVTQSNVIAAIDAKHESDEEIARWIVQTAEPLFLTEREVFRFGGSITFLRRRGAASAQKI